MVSAATAAASALHVQEQAAVRRLAAAAPAFAALLSIQDECCDLAASQLSLQPVPSAAAPRGLFSCASHDGGAGAAIVALRGQRVHWCARGWAWRRMWAPVCWPSPAWACTRGQPIAPPDRPLPPLCLLQAVGLGAGQPGAGRGRVPAAGLGARRARCAAPAGGDRAQRGHRARWAGRGQRCGSVGGAPQLEVGRRSSGGLLASSASSSPPLLPPPLRPPTAQVRCTVALWPRQEVSTDLEYLHRYYGSGQ